MQLSAGSIRSKNTLNILIKNVIDGCAGAIAFYFIGYGLAYGTAEDGSGNPFVGTNDFFLTQTSQAASWHIWFFQWAFAAATATIVSGSVAERCTFEAYVGYSFFLTAIVYPIAAHWCGFSLRACTLRGAASVLQDSANLQVCGMHRLVTMYHKAS